MPRFWMDVWGGHFRIKDFCFWTYGAIKIESSIQSCQADLRGHLVQNIQILE